MGYSTHYDADESREVLRDLAAQGVDAFDYSARTVQRIQEGQEVQIHEDLDVKGKKRAAHDSAVHPNTTPVAIAMDLTGSLGDNPRHFLVQAATLMATLQGENVVPDVTVCPVGFGDHFDSQAQFTPQVGQFEAGVSLDEWVRKMIMHEGGGGSGEESSEMVLWYFANRVDLHSVKRRRERGYLFLITDERCYEKAYKHLIKEVFGVNVPNDVPIEDVIAQVRKNFVVIVLIPRSTQHGRDPEYINFWRNLLTGEVVNGVKMPNPVISISDVDVLGQEIIKAIRAHERVHARGPMPAEE